MKIILITNYITSIPLLNKLATLKLLNAVISVADKNEYNLHIEEVAIGFGVLFKRIPPLEFESQIKAILAEIKPDVVLVYSLKTKINKAILKIPKYGFLNVHFSLLPFYKGRDPLFWQLKNGEKSVGISIHKMDEYFDSGKVITQLAVPVYPGENYGLLNTRLSVLSVDIVTSALKSIASEKEEEVKQQGLVGSYVPIPRHNDLKINWSQQTADEIEFLVNAANPNYGGALTTLNDQNVAILEVTPAGPPENNDLNPGTIIFSDAQHGIFVICKGGGTLRINILRTSEAYLTGFKLAALGINTNHRFV